MVQTTFLKLAVVCLISATVPTVSALSAALSTAQATGLVERQADPSSSCAVSGWQSCGLTGAQANYCCPAGSGCVQFNNNASVICCPQGHNNCQTILPTTCDINQNNATLHPDNQLHSLDFGGPLVKCGNDCCPQGFSCQDNSQCIMKAASGAAASSTSGKGTSTSTSTSTSTLPTTTLPTLSHTSSSSSSSSTGSSSSSKTVSTSASTTSHSPSSTPTTTPTGAAVNASQSTPTPTPTNTNTNPFPAPAILAGFFPGLVLGILLTIAILLCLGRRRDAKEAKSAQSDFSSVTATISDPIYNPRGVGPQRNDFLRRDSAKMFAPHSLSTPAPLSPHNRVRSLFSRSPTFRDGISRSIIPKTPEMARYRTPDLKHEPSTESIKIYSPPNIALGGDVRNTRFTDMMRDAGFRSGEPYLGSPARVSPRREWRP